MPLDAGRIIAGIRTIRRMLASLAVMVAVVVALISAAEAKPKDKTATPKRDALADYIHRVTGPGPVPAATTPGSLWIDNGRLANLVADYKASRVAIW